MKPAKEPPGLRLRVAAAERLMVVLKGANFAPFSASEIADGRDRALANRLVSTALKRHGQLNEVLRRYLERGVPKRSGPFEALLRIALAQLLYLPELGDHSALFLAVEAARRDNRTQHLSKLMNAVLRRAQADAAELRHLPEALLFPEALRQNWREAYGEGAVESFAAALLDGAPLDLTLRDDDPALIAGLGATVIAADTVRVTDRDRPVEAMPGYAEGRWWVQDAAAAIPARLLRLTEGARVLDLCAAPGGKTAQLVKAGYEVTALDSDTERVERMRGNFARLGYHPRIVVADAESWRDDAAFDGILLDAPCSATGTFRRHPEVTWHRDASDIAGRAALQRRLLAQAASCLEPGGVLVYCVCSLEPAEGEAQALWAAREIEGLRLDPIGADETGGLGTVSAEGTLRTLPGMPVGRVDVGGKTGSLDGFFVARFVRL